MTRKLLTLLFFLSTWGVSAAPVATLVSLEGDVTVSRSGLVIPSEKVAEGFLLEAFDTVSTGTTGRADVRLAGLGLSGVVRLDADTSLYLELTSSKKEQTAGVELLNGSVTVKLSAVVGASTLEVRTEVGVFGGTGPSFRVVGSPVGDVLVTCSSGKVVCRVDNRTVYAEPGSVVEALALDQRIQTYAANASTIDSYESTWVRQRKQLFRDQSAVVFRALASRYQLQGGLFQRAWDRVQRDSPNDAGATANLRRAASGLERSLFRIQALRKLLDEGVLSPSVELSRGYAAKDFFRQATLDEALWQPRLLLARGYYRTLAERNGGVFPRAADGSGVTWDSDYFQ